MHTHRAPASKQQRTTQRGAALLIMLVIMVTGVSAVLVNSLSSSTVKMAQQQNTTAALAQAKEALISYAVAYGDTHSNQVNGYLPCPDTDILPEGSSTTSCGNKNVSIIGRLPWRTLDLSALRDGNDECLWYAVSGTYKSMSKTDWMNWDTNGQLRVYAPDGTLLTQPDNQVVAIIFAPGPTLPGQDRSAGTTAPVCGGNYTVANYLDNDTLHTYNNTDIATGEFIQPHTHRDANNHIILTINDQMAYITRQDIWNAVKKRSDFHTSITHLLNVAKLCAALPVSVNFDAVPPTESLGVTVGSLVIGRVPKACLASPLDNWQDNLLYAKCITGNCINSGSCKGGVIFSGERIAYQNRIANSDKNTWNYYLENIPSTTLSAFSTGGTTFSGTSTYLPASSSTDLLVCIP